MALILIVFPLPVYSSVRAITVVETNLEVHTRLGLSKCLCGYFVERRSGREIYLPGNRKFLVYRAGGEEPVNILFQSILKFFFENNVLPIGLLDFYPQPMVLLP